MSSIYIERSPDYLEHHGILGQKWGVRRYQNADGSLTPAGQQRYAKHLVKLDKKRDPKNFAYSEAGRAAFENEVKNNKTLKEFREKNYEESGLHQAQKDVFSRSKELQREATEYAKKTAGDWGTHKNLDEINNYRKVYNDRYDELLKNDKKMRGFMKKLEESERKFESEGYKFVNDFLGESSKIESKNSNAITYVKDIGIKQQTIGERIVLEIYRESGARWNQSGDFSFDTKNRLERELSPDGKSNYDKYLEMRKQFLNY